MTRPGWALLSGALLASYLLLHLPASDVFDSLAARFGCTLYDRAMRGLFLAAGIALAVWLWAADAPTRGRLRRSLLALGACIGVAQALLAVNGVEAIHYPRQPGWPMVSSGQPV